MRPKIDEHDFNFKVKAIRNFLEEGHRVKVSVFFRGREMAFLSRGEEVLDRVMAECGALGKAEGSPRMEGRYMRIMVTPAPQSARPAAPKEGAAPREGAASGPKPEVSASAVSERN